MTWKGFFEGIESLVNTVLLSPLNAVREFELSNWWGANFMTWVFVSIFFAAFYYWMKQLAKFNENGEEDRSQTAHSYLGDS